METEMNCERCGYKTNRLANLKSHLYRKRTCEDILGCGKSILDLKNIFDSNLEFNCGCGAKFSSKQGMNQHKRVCQTYDERNVNIKQIIQENVKLKEALESAQKNTFNNNNNTNTDIDTIACDFGNEDISYVIKDTDFLEKCLKDLFTTGIESVVKKIYFDDEHLENHSIKMQNIKENQVMIKQNGNWVRKHIYGPAQKMIYKSKVILHLHYVQSGEYQRKLDEMMEHDDIQIDYKNDYMYNVTMCGRSENKRAVQQVKGLCSHYKMPYHGLQRFAV